MKMKEKKFNSSKIPQSPLNTALKYLTLRSRSIKEIHDYLAKKQYEEEDINEVIKKLIELKFLNDDNFAKSFIEKSQRKGKSRQAIAYELRLKGIDKDQSEIVFDDSKDDLTTALEYISKRLKQFDRFTPEKRQNKIISRLRSRGYDWEIISKVLKKLKL